MYTYKITLSYNGTNFSGWQIQPDTENTIQAHLKKVILAIINYQDMTMFAASRTDKGVHADGQVVKLKIPKDIDPYNLQRGLNTKLPQEIRVIECVYINDNFNPLQNIQSKVYHYYFSITHIKSAIVNQMALDLGETCRIDIDKMKEACKLITGTHNFEAFSVKGDRNNSIPKKIDFCSIEKMKLTPIHSELYYLKIEAAGFYKYMVRYLMGALIDYSTGKLTQEKLLDCLAGKSSEKPSLKASPHGLNLHKINYIEPL